MKYYLVTTLLLIFSGCKVEDHHYNYSEWRVRGGNKAQQRYSNLTQIDTSNVSQLEVAWTYDTGDIKKGGGTEIETNPIIVDGVLYGVSPKLKAFALDAATGKEKWKFDPFKNSSDPFNHRNRGVAYWEDEEAGNSRILYTAGEYLYALNAETGKLIKSFGNGGKVSIKKGMQKQFKESFAAATSPGIIYKDKIIMGSFVGEGKNSAPGRIVAFNVKTGATEWIFHTIPRPGEFGYDTWEDPNAWKRVGGANSWAGMALDEQRGIVYAPTGSAAPDFYGGNRKGSNLFANTLLALDASTGKRIWHFQTVHHDLWDRDLASPPTLVTVNHNGEEVDAVAQTTKTGFIFLFNRVTGEPLFDIEERPVPTESDLEGEEVWPTQPFPVKPEPLMRQHMGLDDINPYVSQQEQKNLRDSLRAMNSDHMYAPPSLQGTLQFPGFDGGAEWGGNAYDPETDMLYVNTNEVPWILQVIDKTPEETPEKSLPVSLAIGKSTYLSTCVSCHGTDRKGSGRGPSLIGVKNRRSPDEILTIINNGSEMMPAFNQISEARKKAIVNYLMGEQHYAVDINDISDKQEFTGGSDSNSHYILNGYRKFRTREGYPANSPPWGRLSAVNLNTGKIEWQIPLGEYPELTKQGIPITGTENYGGPVVTKGGLLFIAATPDKKFKAYNRKTGALLWETELPYAAFATPSVYQVDGKQYIVIACGGGKLGTKSGDVYVAFALPE